MCKMEFQCSISESVKLGHMRHMALVERSEQGLDELPIATVSEWVLQKMEEISYVLGLSSEGLEVLAWELFAELEKRESGRQAKREGASGNRGSLSRELKNLGWSLSYDKGGVVDGEGFGRKMRGSYASRP